MLKTLPQVKIYLGSDPEFFFNDGEKTIGSEKIIPKEGLLAGYSSSKIVIDGVQAELNPGAQTCRESMASEFKQCFKAIQTTLKEHKGIKADFSQTIEITKTELDSLDPGSRVFGCMPSKNIHNPRAKIAVRDATKYPYRSAGGHIHIGVLPEQNYGAKALVRKINKAIKDPKRLVPILDIIVGNTCVMIDRDPGNIERRKVYGKAGEFRTPKHGLEYRTLSNFWLQNYKLMSLVMGLARMAVMICSTNSKTNRIEAKIKRAVKMRDITKAINENDFNLAFRNFRKIKRILASVTPHTDRLDYSFFPLTAKTMDDFEFFALKGKDNWIKEDPIKHWTTLNEQNNPMIGWEKFLINTVHADRLKEQKVEIM